MTHTTRIICTGCGRGDLDHFLDLGWSPVADAYTTQPTSVSTIDLYPLRVAVCRSCWLMQLTDVLDGETLFGSGYSFHSSASAPLSAYHAAYAGTVIADDEAVEFGSTGRRHGMVEIGCNDGNMLRHFAAAGWPAYGVDPASGPVGVARSRGLDVVGEPFTRTLAEKLRAERGPAGLVIANHVLAHVEDVADFLAGVRHLLTDDGRAMIEVQYVGDLLLNSAFDLVYHEHRNFFSVTSLAAAAARYGLILREHVTTDRQGGSIRALFTPGRPAPAPAPSLSERWLTNLSAYRGMQGRAERIKERLQACLSEFRGGVVAGYGAPAKLTTMAAFCNLDAADIAWISDTTTAKQGRYLPGTSIPIVAPGTYEDPDAYCLFSWNYAGAIMRKERKFTEAGGKWIIPIPAPVIL